MADPDDYAGDYNDAGDYAGIYDDAAYNYAANKNAASGICI